MNVTPINKAPSWRQQVERLDDIGPVSEFLGRFEIHLRAIGRSDKTIDRYLRAARQLEASFAGDISALTRTDMEAYIVARREETSASTAATDFVSLQQFFKFVKLDLSSGGSGFTSPMDGMSAPRFVAPVIKVVPEEFLAALIRQAETGAYHSAHASTIDRTFDDVRDAALLRMFVDTGARLSEITNLSLAEIINAPRITVYGKSKGHGPVPREVEVGEKALRALRRYLRARQQHPGASSGVLWLGQRGPLTPNGVRQMLKKRSRAVGMHVHPHQLRHTKAHDHLSRGGSEGDLMKLMGWRSDQMPKRYGSDLAATRALEAQRAMGFPGDRI